MEFVLKKYVFNVAQPMPRRNLRVEEVLTWHKN